MADIRITSLLALVLGLVAALVPPRTCEAKNDVEDLAQRILAHVRACLPPSAGRSVEDEAPRVRGFARYITEAGWGYPADPARLAVASYGVLGVESSQAVPGVRENAVSWAAPDGTLWLYGGSSLASQYLSDVWRYRPSNGQWTWMGGTSTPGLYGTYGTKGVPAADNLPPASAAGVGWVDSAGRFWLFGGAGLVLAPNHRTAAARMTNWTATICGPTSRDPTHLTVQ